MKLGQLGGVLLFAAGLGGASAGCGDDDPGDASGTGGASATACDALVDAVASPGDPIEGDDYATVAAPFFASYCTRCHSSELASGDRGGAPVGADWDDEAAVRADLDGIRRMVGQFQAMPPSGPMPTCDERFRLVRWIDAGAP